VVKILCGTFVRREHSFDHLKATRPSGLVLISIPHTCVITISYSFSGWALSAGISFKKYHSHMTRWCNPASC